MTIDIIYEKVVLVSKKEPRAFDDSFFDSDVNTTSYRKNLLLGGFNFETDTQKKIFESKDSKMQGKALVDQTNSRYEDLAITNLFDFTIEQNNFKSLVTETISALPALPLYTHRKNYQTNKSISNALLATPFIHTINIICSYCLATDPKFINNLNDLKSIFIFEDVSKGLSQIDPIILNSKYVSIKNASDKSNSLNLLSKKGYLNSLPKKPISFSNNNLPVGKLILLLKLLGFNQEDISYNNFNERYQLNYNRISESTRRIIPDSVALSTSLDKHVFSKILNFIFQK